ncbi:DNA/RNA nuclease SfsA [Chroogloeocystis siderophila]|jgi:sugar fermentation stimulation protein A|uniref:Sugar fermentation stimulation protein homolog n=1 Tax=Chroogloeocystis siderophila 5.2 s.c.1 TaxID=247279 RepID=A0A1U7HK75_9CHRO|nr:DNA/RNA nuclease SfsA [Chroogloeocystis siderophila]OKH23977.1 sugar fermentation stimulation protein SfsA [Chroogloeocystis siderophila 5.2 s.c.1]
MILYHYPTLYPGVLLKRYKRFFADVQLASGEVVTAHCPNTGPMTGICQPDSAVQVTYSDNPKRSLKYTWEMILVNDNEPTWVGVNTSLPNRIVKLALEENLLPLGSYNNIRFEVPYGTDKKSRVDFVLDGDRTTYIEVKSTTWVDGRTALFPDTETTRGQKHLRELTALIPASDAVMLYFINRGDCTTFAPGDSADPIYGQLLRAAIALGLKILPCRFKITPAGIEYLGLAELKI